MPQPILGPAGVTVTTPPSVETYSKVVKVDTSAGDLAGFAAFVLPKGAFISGAYTISMGANATQSVSLGITLGGGEIITTAGVNDNGYTAVGSAGGAYIGTQLAADTLFYAKVNVGVLTTAVYLKVEYYIPQPGNTW